MSYQVKTPVLFVIFNRYDHALKVIEQLKKVRPQKVYLIADGPRSHVTGEDEKCLKVRRVVEAAIDWDCELIKNYAAENMGCGPRLSSGIQWGFEQEEKLIILEDDVFCSENFFRYCDYYLEAAKDNKDISMISGCNLIQHYSQNLPNFFLSKFGGIWGWASWRDRFASYEFQMDANVVDQLKILDATEKEYWRYYLNRIYLKKLNTWDYQWDITRYRQGGLVLVPKNNLTRNIGFDEESTHTFSVDSTYESFGLWEEELKLIPAQKLQRFENYENWYFRLILHKSIYQYLKMMMRNVLTRAQKALKQLTI